MVMGWHQHPQDRIFFFWVNEGSSIVRTPAGVRERTQGKTIEIDYCSRFGCWTVCRASVGWVL